MKDYINAIVQAIVQGLSEFLPISSSGHLALVSHFTGYAEEESTLLLVVLHLGTLVAVFVAFWDIIWALIKELFSLIKDIFTKNFSFKEMSPERRMLLMLMLSCVPLLFFYIPEMLWGIFTKASGNMIVVGLSFLFTATILFLSSRSIKGKKTNADITPKDALTVGVFQCIALLPGVSRSGSTISAGLFRGFDKQTAVRYSFVLGIPPILAGGLVELKDAIGSGMAVNWGALLVGFIVAAIVGYLAIALVNWLIKSDKFIVFSIYTFVLGICVLTMAIIELIAGVDCITALF